MLADDAPAAAAASSVLTCSTGGQANLKLLMSPAEGGGAKPPAIHNGSISVFPRPRVLAGKTKSPTKCCEPVIFFRFLAGLIFRKFNI
jgi:hypothetical protein